DVLILESTYGDRLHEDRSIRQQAPQLHMTDQPGKNA
ncbi:hypothetical protein PSYMO_37631, partial [Pseudomonas amygdali pv. mori str. 301020]